jgi:hypothetical protein
MKQINIPSNSTNGDIAHALAKGSLGAIPFIGALCGETFALAINSPFQKRLQRWMTDVTRELNKQSKTLGDKTVIDLLADEQVLSAVTRATEIAIRTHEEEKRQALIKAVSSSATSKHSNFESLFFEFLDRFQASHIRFLHQIMKNSELQTEDIMEAEPFVEVFSKEELSGDKILLEFLMEDLGAYRNLYTNSKELPSFIKGTCIMSRPHLILTPLGVKFMEFIGIPPGS